MLILWHFSHIVLRHIIIEAQYCYNKLRSSVLPGLQALHMSWCWTLLTPLFTFPLFLLSFFAKCFGTVKIMFNIFMLVFLFCYFALWQHLYNNFCLI